MPLDAGILEIQRGANRAPPGEAPVLDFTPHWGGYYENRTIGVTRFFTARQQGDRPDLVVRTQRNYDISPGEDRVVLSPFDHRDGHFYKVLQVQHVTDENNLPMTDITLERTGELDGSTETGPAGLDPGGL